MNKHIEDLKQQMKTQHIVAYFIPQNDSFFNEITPEYENRIKFITHFSGSSGLAIVTQNKSAIFVDGRYTLQVRMEANAYPWNYLSYTHDSIVQFIHDSVPAGSIIGYNPMLFSYETIKQYEQDFKDYTLHPVTPDFIDELWKHRPSTPNQAPFVFPDKFSGKSTYEKQQNIITTLNEHQAYATFIYHPDTICWILNIRGFDVKNTPTFLSSLYMDSDGRIKLYTYKNRVSKTQSLLKNHNVYAFEDNFHENGIDFLNTLQGRKVLIDPSLTSYHHYQVLQQHGLHLEFHRECGQIDKAIKNPVELAGSIEAHVQDGLAWIKLLYELTKTSLLEGKTEYEVSQRLQYLRYITSPYYVEDSFSAIVGSGPNGAIIHYKPTEQHSSIVQQDQLLLIDTGGQYWYGTTDCTRTIILGTPSQQMKKNYTAVLKAHLKMTNESYPLQVTGITVDNSVRQILQDLGYTFNHGVGHGVGTFLSVHEGPFNIGPKATLPLIPNLILSNEPGYYVEGEYGIRIENLVLSIQKEQTLRFVNATVVPYDRRLIMISLLTSHELQQINTYHHRVYNVLKDKLSTDLQKFLEALTEPL